MPSSEHFSAVILRLFVVSFSDHAQWPYARWIGCLAFMSAYSRERVESAEFCAGRQDEIGTVFPPSWF